MNINETICKNSYDVSFKEKKEACEDGVVAARRMAEKHAKKIGKYLGCMDGFYQGIWDGYIIGQVELMKRIFWLQVKSVLMMSLN